MNETNNETNNETKSALISINKAAKALGMSDQQLRRIITNNKTKLIEQGLIIAIKTAYNEDIRVIAGMLAEIASYYRRPGRPPSKN